MRLLVIALLVGLSTSAIASPSDVSIPDRDAELIKATDEVEVSGTNDLGGIENFAIHDPRAIGQFIELLTDDRYTAVPKNLKPNFKSLSAYQVRLSAKGAPLLELRIIADTVLDLPGENSFYMESDQYSENLMEPLLRLRQAFADNRVVTSYGWEFMPEITAYRQGVATWVNESNSPNIIDQKEAIQAQLSIEMLVREITADGSVKMEALSDWCNANQIAWSKRGVLDIQ